MTNFDMDRARFSPSLPVMWLLGSLILVLIALSRFGEALPAGPDDVLRIVQVRDFLAGQGWLDTAQYRIAPPAGVPMHWSRFVDLPIAAIILLLSPLIGAHWAETVAMVAIPLLTYGVVVACIGWIGRGLVDRASLLVAAIVPVLFFTFSFQFSPFRVDHHAWQVTSYAVAVAAVLRMPCRWGAPAAGLAMAFGMMISLEVLPLAAAIAGVLFLRRFRPGGERAWFSNYLVTLAVSLGALYLATHGLGIGDNYCDAVSPAHLVFFTIVAGGVKLAERLTRTFWIEVSVIGVASLGALALYLQAAPECAGGPFAELDPLVRDMWYLRVFEGLPAWVQDFSLAAPVVFQALVAIAANVWLWRTSAGRKRNEWFEHLLFLLAAFALGMLVWRSSAFIGVFVALPLAVLTVRGLTILVSAAPIARRGAIALLLFVLIAPSTPLAVMAALAPGSIEINAQDDGYQLCEVRPSIATLARLPKSTIFTQLDFGPEVILRTPHSVVATGHHRGHDAMLDVIRGFTLPADQARKIVAKYDSDYIVVCPVVFEAMNYADDAPGGLMAMLAAGTPPAWLEPVDLGTPEDFKVYRVVK